MKEYTHVVIDKQGVGLNVLRQRIDAGGLQTAQSLGIALSQGSMKLEHHLHVFLWDDSVKGINGRLGVQGLLPGMQINQSCFLVRVRWPNLTESGSVFSGTLKGDNMHAGPPSGPSSNGAWAYKGNIPRKFCFIEDLDTAATNGFKGWCDGQGWP